MSFDDKENDRMEEALMGPLPSKGQVDRLLSAEDIRLLKRAKRLLPDFSEKIKNLFEGI